MPDDVCEAVCNVLGESLGSELTQERSKVDLRLCVCCKGHLASGGHLLSSTPLVQLISPHPYY